MSGGGTTIDLAIAALFELCIPIASGGQIEQTFPEDLVVPLSAGEERDYADTIAGCKEVRRIKSKFGFILFGIEDGWCKVITADGDPNLALNRYLDRLDATGGFVSNRENRGQWANVHGTIPINEANIIAVVFSGNLANPNAGFYGSAALARKHVLG